MDIDLKKLDTAILYVQRIADGNNPVNNMPAEEDSILNNPNVIRCMYFVKEVLEGVKRNDGIVGRKPKNKEKEEFPLDSLKTFVYLEDKPITKVVEQLNAGIDKTKFRKIGYRVIQDWLKMNGYLEERLIEKYGKIFNVPSPKGEQIGIRCEERVSMRGAEYMTTLYGEIAQEFIVKNLERIINGEVVD